MHNIYIYIYTHIICILYTHSHTIHYSSSIYNFGQVTPSDPMYIMIVRIIMYYHYVVPKYIPNNHTATSDLSIYAYHYIIILIYYYTIISIAILSLSYA